jgi:transcriptional regulator GlxA family with amidase domain
MPLRIALLVPPNFQLLCLSGPATVFEVANIIAGKRLYDLRILSDHGGKVVSSIGTPIETTRLSSPTFDTLLAFGTMQIEPSSPRTLKFLRRAAKTCRRVGSVCTGAFVLAETGLLNGRRATTHWLYARQLQQQFPQMKMDEDRIFIVDGPIWTSAGMSAGIDLALEMVDRDFGTELARSVAKKLVLYHRRAGGQSQHSELLELRPKSDRLQNALTYAKRNLRRPLSIDELAKAANLSPRQFSRTFRAVTGQTPAKAVENLRLETARMLVEQSVHSIEEVAAETGFGDSERMRRAFLRGFGQPPQAIRRNVRSEMAWRNG